MKSPAPRVISFEVGLAVLAAFDRDTPRLTLGEVAERAGISRFSARRYLASLLQLGYAETDGRRYALTHRALKVGASFLSSSDLVAKLQPLLHQLTAEVGESSYLSLPDGGQTVVIAKATANRVTNRSHSLGASFPLWVTSAGLCIAAAMPRKEMTTLIQQYRPRPFTLGTLLDPRAIRSEVERARLQGYAVSEAQLDDLVRGVAVPLFDQRSVLLGAISVNMFIGPESVAAAVRRVLPALQSTAQAARGLLQD